MFSSLLRRVSNTANTVTSFFKDDEEEKKEVNDNCSDEGNRVSIFGMVTSTMTAVKSTVTASLFNEDDNIDEENNDNDSEDGKKASFSDSESDGTVSGEEDPPQSRPKRKDKAQKRRAPPKKSQTESKTSTSDDSSFNYEDMKPTTDDQDDSFSFSNPFSSTSDDPSLSEISISTNPHNSVTKMKNFAPAKSPLSQSRRTSVEVGAEAGSSPLSRRGSTLRRQSVAKQGEAAALTTSSASPVVSPKAADKRRVVSPKSEVADESSAPATPARASILQRLSMSPTSPLSPSNQTSPASRSRMSSFMAMPFGNSPSSQAKDEDSAGGDTNVKTQTPEARRRSETSGGAGGGRGEGDEDDEDEAGGGPRGGGRGGDPEGAAKKRRSVTKKRAPPPRRASTSPIATSPPPAAPARAHTTQRHDDDDDDDDDGGGVVRPGGRGSDPFAKRVNDSTQFNFDDDDESDIGSIQRNASRAAVNSFLKSEDSKSGWLFRENEAIKHGTVTEQFIVVWVQLLNGRLSYSDADLEPMGGKPVLARGYVDIPGAEVKLRFLDVKDSGLGPGHGYGAEYGHHRPPISSDVGKYCFQVRQIDATVTFSCLTDVERDEWVALLRKVAKETSSGGSVSSKGRNRKALSRRLSIKGLLPRDSPTPLVSTYLELEADSDDSDDGKEEKGADYPTLSGQLKRLKSNFLKSPKFRWYKLENGELKSYVDAEFVDAKVKKQWSLQNAQCFAPDSPNVLLLGLQLASGQRLELEAENPQKYQQWKKAFMETISGGSTKVKDKTGRRKNAFDLRAHSGAAVVGGDPADAHANAKHAPSHAHTQGQAGKGRSSMAALVAFRGSGSEGHKEDWELESFHIKLGDKKSPATVQALNTCLSRHFLLKQLQDLDPLINSLHLQVALSGDVIIHQGSPGDVFYILESGHAEIIKDGRAVGQMGGAQPVPFGELALLNSSGRTATIKCVQKCVLWTLDRSSFRFFMAAQATAQRREKVKFLKSVKLFEQVDDEKLGNVADAMTHVSFAAKERIIKEGEQGDRFYMIVKGHVSVSQQSSFLGGSKELTRLGPNKYFGELALVNNEPRKASVTAVDPVECWTLDRINFTALLGSVKEAVDESIGLNILKNVKLLQTLSTRQLQGVSRCLKSVSFAEGDVIIKQGDEGDNFFMIASGEVSVEVNHVQVAELGKDSFFGEVALMRNEKRGATVTALTAVTCLVLSRIDFVNLLGPLEAIINAEAQKRAAAVGEKKGFGLMSAVTSFTSRVQNSSLSSGFLAPSKSVVHSKFRNPSFELSNFRTRHLLGTGTFAKVFLVRNNDGKDYALKTLNKQFLFEANQIEAVMREREIMAELDHPFIAACYATCIDDKNIYMVQQAVLHGDLWTLLTDPEIAIPLTKMGGLTSAHAAFYAANALCALQHMHNADICYRDLKPENMCIDVTGYIKVVDLGCAKKVEAGGVTSTLCGTPEYLTPEMILSKGHNRGVDVWALGILIYELLTKTTPFAHDNTAMVYQSIVECTTESIQRACKSGFDPTAENLITALVNPVAMMRLGMQRNAMDDVWNHAFFRPVQNSASRVARREVPPPFVPTELEEDALDNVFIYDDEDDRPDEMFALGKPYQGNMDFSQF